MQTYDFWRDLQEVMVASDFDRPQYTIVASNLDDASSQVRERIPLTDYDDSVELFVRHKVVGSDKISWWKIKMVRAGWTVEGMKRISFDELLEQVSE